MFDKERSKKIKFLLMANLKMAEIELEKDLELTITTNFDEDPKNCKVTNVFLDNIQIEKEIISYQRNNVFSTIRTLKGIFINEIKKFGPELFKGETKYVLTKKECDACFAGKIKVGALDNKNFTIEELDEKIFREYRTEYYNVIEKDKKNITLVFSEEKENEKNIIGLNRLGAEEIYFYSLDKNTTQMIETIEKILTKEVIELRIKKMFVSQ